MGMRADAKTLLSSPHAPKRKRQRLSASSSFTAVLSSLKVKKGLECKPVGATSLAPDSHLCYTGQGMAKLRRGEPVTKDVDFFESSVEDWKHIRRRGILDQLLQGQQDEEGECAQTNGLESPLARQTNRNSSEHAEAIAPDVHRAWGVVQSSAVDDESSDGSIAPDSFRPRSSHADKAPTSDRTAGYIAYADQYDSYKYLLENSDDEDYEDDGDAKNDDEDCEDDSDVDSEEGSNSSSNDKASGLGEDIGDSFGIADEELEQPKYQYDSNGYIVDDSGDKDYEDEGDSSSSDEASSLNGIADDSSSGAGEQSEQASGECMEAEASGSDGGELDKSFSTNDQAAKNIAYEYQYDSYGHIFGRQR